MVEGQLLLHNHGGASLLDELCTAASEYLWAMPALRCNQLQLLFVEQLLKALMLCIGG